MNRQWLVRDCYAIVMSIVFLLLGFLAVTLSRGPLHLEGDTVLLVVLLLPIIVYTIFSGRLIGLRAGGLEAKFVDIAEQSVQPVSETVEPSVAEMRAVEKRSLGELERKIGELDESKPIILTVRLGTRGCYRQRALLEYAEALSRYRAFKFVVILDDENKFVAYIPSWAVLQILRIDALGQQFTSIINQSDIRELRRYPGVVTRTISTNSTNVDALREMTAQNLEALVVVDEHRRLGGVVEREQLLSKLMLGMAR